MNSQTQAYLTLDQLDRNRVYRRTIVRILRKWEARNPKANNMLMGMDFLFIDEKGNTIQASLHHSLISKFGNQLGEGNIIEICNFNVQSANNRTYKVSSHPSFIRLTERVKVNNVEQQICQIPEEKFQIRDPEELLKMLDVTNHLYDAIGYIIKVDKSDLRSESGPTLRKVVVTLLMKGEVELPVTIWAEKAELFEDKYRVQEDNNTVLIMTSVLVKTFRGQIGFSASAATKFYLNHVSDSVNEFRSSMKYEGGCLVNLGTVVEEEQTEEKQQTINDIWDFISTEEPMDKEFLCEATITEIVTHYGWSYISCSVCSKKLKKTGTSLFCQKCGKSQATGVLRFKIEVIVDDGCDSATFVIFDDEAEKIIGKTAAAIAMEDVGDHSNDEGLNNVPTCVRSIVGKTYLFKVKVKEYDFNAPHQSFAVLKIKDNQVEKKDCQKKRQEREESSDDDLQKKSRLE